ncbi:MAG: coenzyme F420-0:L-glutamate ligase [Candidatus Kariarchaeaceae archaeon]
MQPITLFPVTGIPLIQEGDNIAQAILDALDALDLPLIDGDVLVIAHTIISRSLGLVFFPEEISPSEEAIALSAQTNKTPEHLELVLRGANKVLKVERNLVITETKLGFIQANSGVDTSNAGLEKFLTLPPNPDNDAKIIVEAVKAHCNVEIAVIVSDSMGRALRGGIVNNAIGCYGLEPIKSYLGQKDLYGYELKVTTVAIADELTSAAELLIGEADEAIPVVLIRGYNYEKGTTSAQVLARPEEQRLFK